MDINNEVVDQEDPKTFNSIQRLLESNSIEHTVLKHEPVKTSEEAAKVRGVSLASGAKAMLLFKKEKNVEKIPLENYILAVMSAEKKFSWKAVRKELSCKQLDMSSPEQVKEISGCIPGAVPPFGSIFGVKTIVDQSLISQGDTINFNAGLRTQSVRMKVEDYLKVEKPQILNFTE